MAMDGTTLTEDQAQSLRLKRMAWGFGVQACAVLIIVALFSMGMIPGRPVLIYLSMIAAIDIGFFSLVKTRLNLRFKDPSLTAPQIALSIFPIIYIMYHVTEPQARVALVLMGTSSLLFGMFRLNTRGMLLMAGAILGGYLCLILALYSWAPARVNLLVEIIVLFAFACAMAINGYLGSVVSDMRRKLKIQNRELAELATLDPLTRLPNRRSLMAHLTTESALSERRRPGQDGMCVAMLDVDNFKGINDSWGHEAGDKILCGIGDALRAALRENELVGRFGGEEFVIILPNIALEAAHALATRIRDTIGAMRFSELPADRQVTVSIGVAAHRSGERIEDTLKRADQALYRAKDDGRNRVAS